jgi:hypothetical protein
MNKGVFIFLIFVLAFILTASSTRAKLSVGNISFINSANDIYNKLEIKELSFEAFKIAFSGFTKLQSNNLLHNDSLLTIIDFSLPSTEERFFIIDLKNLKVLKESLVAHGKSTGDLCPESFSNRVQSHQSSLGFYITENTYEGKHGYSLRLNGIEENINNNAKERAIVIHGANYVSRSYIKKYGRIGRSFSCPALPIEQNKQIIDLIKNNSCLFIYFPTSDYLKKSKLVIPDNYSQIIAE